MKLPQLQGSSPPSGFYLYAACDEHYFDQYATSFVTSTRANAGCSVHLHVFNPRPDQIDRFGVVDGVSISFEHISEHQFDAAAQRWQSQDLDAVQQTQLARTRQAMIKGHDRDIQQRMLRTYYACARFWRLQELRSLPVFAMDVDAVIRGDVGSVRDIDDVVIHRVQGKKARYLAGGIYLADSPRAWQFLDAYAQSLRAFFLQDYVYWGIDQDQLEITAPDYRPAQLPSAFIDWDMHPSSLVWTAKGTRKESPIFVSERDRYRS